MTPAELTAARERLAWILAEYGEDDIDYQTFGPLVAALDVAICAEVAHSAPPVAQQKLTTYLPDAEAERLRERAEAEGRTVTGLLRFLARSYLEAGPTALPQERTAGPDPEGV